jgi:hypothetical protein
VGFWEDVDRALAGAWVTTTADELIDALNLLWHPPSSGDAFYAGSGGDDELIDALDSAYWRLHDIEADYHWQATSKVDGSRIEYSEGDVSKL